ncbi:MAG: hypothetical protein ACPKPY_05520 [Nitrososphaeraceae archaeon]
MTQVISGTSSDLTTPNEEVVLNMLETNWPTTAFSPTASEIRFSTMGWTDTKTYQITTEHNDTKIENLSINGKYQKHEAKVNVHLWIRSSVDQRPQSAYDMINKTEQIINENMTNVSHGITSIKITRNFGNIESAASMKIEKDFDNIKSITFATSKISSEIAQSLWHTQAEVILTYFKAIT